MGESEKEIVVWPQYFDRNLPRRLGRRVPKDLAVDSPKPEELEEALASMGLEFEGEDARYPRVWWQASRKIVVRVRGGVSKTAFLREVAAKLKELREKRGRKKT